jgi:hypothetical protein
MKKRILILKKADMAFDIRCQRIAKHLDQEYDITVVGTDLCPNLNTKQVKIVDYDHARLSLPERVLRKIRRDILLRNIQDQPFENRLSQDKWIPLVMKYLSSNTFEVIIACDIDSIIAVVNSDLKSKLIGDMHEHAPTELANSPGWTDRVGNYKRWQCDNFLPEVKNLFTVSKSLAKLFESEFGLSQVNVLRNVASYCPRVRPISESSPRNFIHHGIAAPIRGLEEHAVLAAALGLEYSVSMLLKPVEWEYYNSLKSAQKYVKNFFVLNPVEPENMIHEITRFDAGIYLLNPLTSQLRVTLPNKFFEFVQARLPVYSGGLIEIDELIDDYGVGVKLGTFNALEASSKIKNSQDLDWRLMGENLDYAAKELSSEMEFKKISVKIEELLSS